MYKGVRQGDLLSETFNSAQEEVIRIRKENIRMVGSQLIAYAIVVVAKTMQVMNRIVKEIIEKGIKKPNNKSGKTKIIRPGRRATNINRKPKI